MPRHRHGRAEPEGRDSGPPADPVAVAREIALRQLTARSRTRAELERALGSRGVPPDAAAEVLDRFEELRLVDDAGFAEQWVESRQRAGRSARVLGQELRAKGVDAETVTETLAHLDDESDYRAALAFAHRKVRSLRGVTPQVRDRRLTGALARRGFSSPVIRRVLAEVTGGLVEPEECDPAAD
nr:regulatory protein RecX [Propionibacterium sp.]